MKKLKFVQERVSGVLPKKIIKKKKKKERELVERVKWS